MQNTNFKMRFLIVNPIHLFGIFLFPELINAVIYKDLEMEAIIVDDSPEAPTLLELQPLIEEDSREDIGEKCGSNNGINGKCMTMADCYPFFGYVDSVDLIKTGFYEFIENSTQACQSGKSGQICCGDRIIPFVRIHNKNKAVSSRFTQQNKNADFECGKSEIAEDRLFSRPAFRKEFPYAVAILKDGIHICGGSLISSSWILTAAHCVNDVRDTNVLSVNVGELDLASPYDHVSSGVDKIVYHSGFTMRNLKDDIALIRLSKPVSFSDHVQPICLNEEKFENLSNYRGYLIGWGRTEAGKPPTTTLQTMKMRAISNNKCKDKFQAIGKKPPALSDGNLCIDAQIKFASEDCMGDSGSPFSFYSNHTAKLVGFVSWSIGCGNWPGIYSRVDHYLNWIHKNMI